MILSTVCSIQGNFMVYLKPMVYSLRYSGFDKKGTPLYIFVDDILKEDEDILKKMWNIKIIKVDNDEYAKKCKDNPKFWALEVYRPKHYKQKDDVLFIDADTVIVNDITGIKKYFTGIAMMRERGRACFNSGVVCINKKYINIRQYKELMDFPVNYKEFGNDQQVLNKVFNFKIIEIPKYYNMLVGGHDEFGKITECGIVHYIHKPDRTASQQLVGQQYLDVYNKYNEEMKCIK